MGVSFQRRNRVAFKDLPHLHLHGSLQHTRGGNCMKRALLGAFLPPFISPTGVTRVYIHLTNMGSDLTHTRGFYPLILKQAPLLLSRLLHAFLLLSTILLLTQNPLGRRVSSNNLGGLSCRDREEKAVALLHFLPLRPHRPSSVFPPSLGFFQGRRFKKQLLSSASIAPSYGDAGRETPTVVRMQ